MPDRTKDEPAPVAQHGTTTTPPVPEPVFRDYAAI